MSSVVVTSCARVIGMTGGARPLSVWMLFIRCSLYVALIHHAGHEYLLKSVEKQPL